MKVKSPIPLEKLNLTSRFLFDEVMEDRSTHQDVLSIILGREIPLLDKNETEKELRVLPEIRSIRMDVFAMDEEMTVYNTEMQRQRKTDLAKRSRYYQALVDTSLLDSGIPDYNLLNRTYIILIATFDLFGYERYKYTFEAKCCEEPQCQLEDEAVRIFLNTRGKNDNEVSRELVDFLHYVEESTDETAEQSDSDRIRRIHNRVRKVKASKEVGVKYMQAWEERYFEKEEARKEGLAEGRAEGKAEGRAEGLEQGLEQGIARGAYEKLKEIVRKKLAKGKSLEEIADSLEESIETIQKLIEEIREDGQNIDAE